MQEQKLKFKTLRIHPKYHFEYIGMKTVKFSKFGMEINRKEV